MKLIKPSIEIIEQKPGIEGMLKHIEYCGRTSYKSYDKITDDSYKRFIDMLVKSGHNSCLEHGTVYLKLIGVFLDPTDCDVRYGNYVISHYIDNKYSKVVIKHDERWKSDVYITTNYRTIIENNWLNDLKYICEPTEFHAKRVTVKVICSIGTSRELNRHRISITEQSTRYCNFSKDKFGNEITFILPCWMDEKQKDMSLEDRDICGNTYAEVCFKENLIKSEKVYFALLKEGWKPQQAREILPLATATEVVYTAFLEDWKHLLSLRSPKYGATGVHPNAAVIGDMIYDEFIKRGYLK